MIKPELWLIKQQPLHLFSHFYEITDHISAIKELQCFIDIEYHVCLAELYELVLSCIYCIVNQPLFVFTLAQNKIYNNKNAKDKKMSTDCLE